MKDSVFPLMLKTATTQFKTLGNKKCPLKDNLKKTCIKTILKFFQHKIKRIMERINKDLRRFIEAKTIEQREREIPVGEELDKLGNRKGKKSRNERIVCENGGRRH